MATYEIKWLKNKLGVKFFPVTHIKAVRDDYNVDLQTLLGQKQDILVSGTNIKTVNSLSILGSGNLEIEIPESAVASTTTPLMDGTASVGTELAFARGDHRHPSDTSKADKSATVSAVTYNTTSKKITKTINGTTSDVVTAAKIVTDGGGITSHQDISGKADKATTLDGYGITDAKISNGTITLGSNTITPLTSFTETDPVFSASVAASIKASDITNWNGKTSNTGTITGVSVNGTSVATSGVANITSVPASILSGAIKNGVTATTLSSGDNSTKVATTAYVDTAINNLPEPMIFKGSLGTGGTITSLPTAATSNTGYTYKVITAGTYASQSAKIGDTFISDGTTWNLIPSGDEPSGTVTSITLKANSPISIDSTSAITTSGTRTISHANSGVTAGTYRSVTVNATGHVTAGTNPTTLSGYGITDAKIASGTITLGSNTITPLTASSTLDATKLSGTIPTECYSNTDTKVTLTATTTNSAYEILFSGTADNTSRTEGVRKTSTLTYNPSTKALVTGGTVNGYTLAAASAKGVDTSIAASSSSTNLPTSAAVASFVEGKGYLTSHLSLANYVTLNTEQTISALKTFTAGITTDWMNIKHSTNTSQARGISWLDTSGTSVARLLYHNTAQNIIINSTGAADIWTDAVGKYSLFVGNNKLTYNTYPILTTNNFETQMSGKYVKVIPTSSSYLDNTTGSAVIGFNQNGNPINTSSLYGAVFQWSNTNSVAPATDAQNNWYFQLIGSTTTDLYWRRRWNGGNWSTAKLLLDSGNYTDYTVTKTGTGASGTWGINVSGTATGLAYKTLNGDDVDSTAGTFAFGGNNYSTWSGTDYAGLQVSGYNDKFQIAANNGHLVFRQNDSGGTNTSWNAWATVIDTTNASTLFTDLSKDSNRKLSITIGGTTKTLEYYPNSIQAYTHNRIESTTSPFKWYKIFTVTINARYAYGSANFMITDLGRSVSGDSRQSHIVCHYQQQNAFGSAPFVNLYILDGNCGTQYLKGVYTLNSNSTTIDIYTCASYSYMRPAITNICTHVSNGTWNYPIGGVVDAPTFNIDSEYQTQMQAQNFNSTVYSKFMYFRNNANDANAGYVGAGATSNNNIYLMAYSGNQLLLGANGVTMMKFYDDNVNRIEISVPIHIDGALGIADVSGSGLLVYHPSTTWSGISSTQWGVGAASSQGVIRSSNTDLIHYKSGTNTTIVDSSNIHNLLVGACGTGTSNLTDDTEIITSYAAAGGFDATGYENKLYRRTGAKVWGYIKSKIAADTTLNVASATKLQTARTLWGQSFDGTANVSGNMTGVGSITANDNINANRSDAGDTHVKVSNSNGEISLDIHVNRGVYDDTNSKWLIGTNGTNTFLMDGNVGVGTTSPTTKLHVNGNILATGEITAYSDIRLKKNIKPLTPRGTLKPVTYEKDGKKGIGFIAQDVLEIYPELVTELGEDKMLSLNYAQLTAVLLAEILELKEEIKQLKNNK